MAKIKTIQAREILDSRGNPTVETTVILDDDSQAINSVPSGASRGKYEALELRDGDSKRYQGMGVLTAVNNVNTIIAPKLKGKEATEQIKIDKLLIELDGTPNKSKLGANAILSVSQGIIEAAATSRKIPTYQYINSLYGFKETQKLPGPTFNLINGGKHGAGNLEFQEFHVIPSTSKTYSEALRTAEEIYQTLEEVLVSHGAIHSVGDEGGYAPNLFTNADALELLVSAIKKADYVLNRDVFLGLDVAAGSFYKDNKYQIKDRTMPMQVDDLIVFYEELNQQYPLFSLEDGFYEDDWEGWVKITQSLTKTIIVGDDLLATNKERVREAIKKKACNGILVKPNQIGTISETIYVITEAREAGWKIIVSHRSGETNEDFIADFAVGVNADFTKFGAPARGERVAKYNRLLAIESEIKEK
ncbi:phosphopyruvate hydratase [Microgenomates group bacterium RBG_19FT_COMBO_39_10]|nr:MAG: phosphopyruvate hydratase [Microgenomates group bacterium RBG_19FT_COMBO_39_10]